MQNFNQNEINIFIIATMILLKKHNLTYFYDNMRPSLLFCVFKIANKLVYFQYEMLNHGMNIICHLRSFDGGMGECFIQVDCF